MTDRSDTGAGAEQPRGPTIVVGYDGSGTAQAALLFAARQCGKEGKVFIVHAFEPPPGVPGSPNRERILFERRARGEALLRELPLNGPELAGPEYELELIAGAPARVLEDVARVRHADEIVIGARGLGRVRALLGSVSHSLLHIADRPVVVIPSAVVSAGR